jgi:hypothetical protein
VASFLRGIGRRALGFERLEAFGSAARAPNICPIELDVMAQRYCTGALRQVVH